MNSEKKSSCETCQGVFANDHELSMHDCVEIKKEPQDLKDVSESRDQDHLDKENFKEELSDPENQIDKNEQHFSNEKGNHDLENEEDKPLRKKRHKREKRKSRRVLQNLNFPEPPANLLENYHDLDLSVEFLSQVFKYVDELCEYINNGDQNLDRSSVVIQNLNYAVSCYRVNLTEPKPDIQEEDFQEDQEDFKYEIDPPVDFPSNDEEDEEYKEPKPKKKKVKKKAERKSEIKEETNGNDDTFQDESGKKKRKWERKGKPVVEIEIEKLLSFMNMTENKFSCKFCDQTYNTGPHLFTHLNATHYSEIKAKIDSGNFELVNLDCINAICKKLYGYKNRDLWCGLCTTSFKRYNVVNAMKNKKEPELCPDCGKYVTNLKVHQQTTHSVGKETCPHCNLTGIKWT